MSRRIAVFGIVSLSVATAVHGQGFGGRDYNDDRPVQFGIGGGAIIPRTNARAQDVLTGATGQAYLLLRIAPGFPALRIGADFSRMKFGDPRAGAATTTLGSTRTQLGGIASMRVDLLPGPVRP